MRRGALFFILPTIAALLNAAPAADEPADEPVVRAVAKVLPAVVNINTERIVRRSVVHPYDLLFHEYFGGRLNARELRQKVQSLGSGFVVDPEGYIVTNEHVVERAADLKIQVTMLGGDTYDAQYIAGDAESDLAFIKIDAPRPLPFVSLEDLSPNLLGQTLIVLGNPLGYGSSVSRGILSATNRTVAIDRLEFTDLIQTDAAINPGNSGGPIIDIGGRLAGVSSVKMAYTPQGVPTQGIGFGIPAQRVKEMVAGFKQQAAQQSEVASRMSAAQRVFGLTLQNLTPDLARALGILRSGGVLVTDVEAGSPAERVGLQRGLVIYRVGRYEVSRVEEVETLLQEAMAGGAVEMLVGGGGRNARLLQTVTLIAR